jgi:CheY-like chemotaxis protein
MPDPFLLLIDDDFDDFLLIEEALEEIDFACTIHAIMDPVQVFPYLASLDKYKYPDLILLDLNLPKINGKKILTRLKNDEKFMRIPVVMLTTSGAEEDIKYCFKHGCNSYIIKPSKFEDLIQKLHSIKRYWFQTAMRPDTLNK